MKRLIPISFIFLISCTSHKEKNSDTNTKLNSDSYENLENVEYFYLTSKSSDTIKITAKTYNKNDTTYLHLEKISNGEKKFLQEIKSLYYFPLEIEQCPAEFGLGFYLKYDPAVKNGNAFLFLLNEEKKQFIKIDGFRDLGLIKTLNIKGKKYFYSYRSCGCADECWQSNLFEIKNYKIDTLAFLSCDCTNLIEKEGNKKDKVSDNCDYFNNLNKFERIKNYWTKKIKNSP